MTSSDAVRTAMALTGALAALATATTAARAAPIALSAQGSEPRIAVDASGTGHVVWQEKTAAGGEATKYCRLPRGATACATTHSFQDIRGGQRGESYPPSWVLAPGGGRVVVLVHMCCDSRYGPGLSGLFAFVSDDGGLTFGPERLIGSGEPSGDAVALDRDRVAVVTESTTGGTWVQVATLDGTTEARALVGEGDRAYGGSLGVSGGVLAVTFNDLRQTFTRTWPGTGDPNDAASWTAPAPVGATTKATLAGSPAAFRVMLAARRSGREVLEFHGLTAAGAGPALATPARGTLGDFVADASDRHHLIWRTEGDRWFYRRSRLPGWTPYATLPQRIEVLPPVVRADADASGRGWAVTGPRQIVAAPLPRLPRPPRSRVCARGACLVARDPIAADGCLAVDGAWRFAVQRAPGGTASVRGAVWWTNPALRHPVRTRPVRFTVEGEPRAGWVTLRVRAELSGGRTVLLSLRFQRCP